MNTLSIQFYDHTDIEQFMQEFSDLHITQDEHQRIIINSKDIYDTEMKVFYYLYHNHIKAEKSYYRRTNFGELIYGGCQMKSFIAFSRKEFIEYLRTYKLFIVIMIFLLLGFLNPITAKYLPEIVSLVMPEGVMNIPTPTVFDSWAQFFKNVPQMGLIIFLVVFGGVMSNELSKGTLVNILSKGFPRQTIVLSKFISVSLI